MTFAAGAFARILGWIGTVITILLSITLCQFVYLPYSAVPAWNEVQWTNGLQTSGNNTLFPAILFGVSGLNITAISSSAPGQWSACLGSDEDCTVPNPQTYYGQDIPLSYWAFNSIQGDNTVGQAEAGFVPGTGRVSSLLVGPSFEFAVEGEFSSSGSIHL